MFTYNVLFGFFRYSIFNAFFLYSAEIWANLDAAFWICSASDITMWSQYSKDNNSYFQEFKGK